MFSLFPPCSGQLPPPICCFFSTSYPKSRLFSPFSPPRASLTSRNPLSPQRQLNSIIKGPATPLHSSSNKLQSSISNLPGRPDRPRPRPIPFHLRFLALRHPANTLWLAPQRELPTRQRENPPLRRRLSLRRRHLPYRKPPQLPSSKSVCRWAFPRGPWAFTQLLPDTLTLRVLFECATR